MVHRGGIDLRVAPRQDPEDLRYDAEGGSFLTRRGAQPEKQGLNILSISRVSKDIKFGTCCPRGILLHVSAYNWCDEAVQFLAYMFSPMRLHRCKNSEQMGMHNNYKSQLAA